MVAGHATQRGLQATRCSTRGPGRSRARRARRRAAADGRSGRTSSRRRCRRRRRARRRCRSRSGFCACGRGLLPGDRGFRPAARRAVARPDRGGWIRPCGGGWRRRCRRAGRQSPTPIAAIELLRLGTMPRTPPLSLDCFAAAPEVLGCGSGVAAAGREGQVGERVPEGDVVGVHAVTQVVRTADELALDDLERDVDDVVTEPAAVREALVVATDDTEPVGLSGDRSRHVEAKLLARGDLALGHVEALDTGEEHRDEVVARRLRARRCRRRPRQLGQLGVGDVLQELRRRCVGLEALKRVLELQRDDDLVDQRVAQSGDLLEASRWSTSSAVVDQTPIDRVLLGVAVLRDPAAGAPGGRPTGR